MASVQTTRIQNPRFFDDKESYSNRLKILVQFVQPEQPLTEQEKLFLLRGDTIYHSFILQIADKISKSKKPLEPESSTFLRSLSVSLEVFGKIAFRQVYSSKLSEVLQQMLSSASPTKTRKQVFFLLLDSICINAFKCSEWETSIFEFLNLEVFTQKAEMNVVDENGENKYINSVENLHALMIRVVEDYNSFIALFTIFQSTLERLYVARKGDSPVNDDVHAIVTETLSSLKFNYVVFMCKNSKSLVIIEKVFLIICQKMLQPQDQFRFFSNKTAFKKIFECFITNEFTTDLEMGLKNTTSDGVTQIMFREFQKTILRGIEIVLFSLTTPDSDTMISFGTEIKQMYSDILEKQKFISNDLKRVIGLVSLSVVWRIGFCKSVTASIETTSIQTVKNDIQKTKAADFVISALPLWVEFMTDQKDWDLFFQKIVIVYDSTFFVKDIRDLFVSLTLLIIKIYNHIEMPNEDEQKMHGYGFCVKSEEFSPSRKLDQFNVNNMEHEKLLFFWKQMFLLVSNASCVSQGNVLFEWIVTMRLALRCLIIGEVESHYQRDEIISIATHFFPFFVGVLQNQKDESVVLESIKGLIDIITQPRVVYNKIVYSTVSAIIGNAFECSETLSIQIASLLSRVFIRGVQMDFLVLPILQLLCYKFPKDMSEEEELGIIQLVTILSSINIPQNVLPTEKKVVIIGHVMTNIFSCCKSPKVQGVVLWGIGRMIVQTEKHSEVSNIVLLNVITQTIQKTSHLVEQGLEVLVYIVRSLCQEKGCVVELILNFIMKMVVRLQIEKESVFFDTCVMALVEIFQTSGFVFTNQNNENAELLKQVVEIDAGQNVYLQALCCVVFSNLKNCTLKPMSNENEKSSWYVVSSSLVSITPNNNGESNVVVRSPNGIITTQVTTIESRETNTIPIAPIMKGTKTPISVIKQRVRQNVLYNKLQNEKCKQKLFDIRESVNKESYMRYKSQQQTTLEEYQKTETLINSVEESLFEEIVPQPNPACVISQDKGFVLGMFMQRNGMTRKVKYDVIKDKVKALDALGTLQILEIGLKGQEEDGSFIEFKRLFESNEYNDMYCVHSSFKITNKSKFVVIWNDDIERWSDELKYMETIICCTPIDNTVRIRMISKKSYSIGPILDNTIVSGEDFIQLLKEAATFCLTSFKENIVYKRLEIIKQVQQVCQPPKDVNQFFLDGSALFQ
ncbi:hypothetical protein EIN_405160 [Entamoeba invadens IP1]|uniref:Uncharacterized protein n=1 Tax=Entamoeba invadens IP1 TaxID=370355 RepID=A0A0A1U6S5_ENTIV|nr:hypothetical protein EIN_405160 [Entamoeba invadens IP1]ELP90102.1 hypothetical protein EIN_405160 [Entamoeba invadens IP1]|eukprot:XP_004256873.1 hypothetical protein EIN_405160 [Entamoeba invadens IP1]